MKDELKNKRKIVYGIIFLQVVSLIWIYYVFVSGAPRGEYLEFALFSVVYNSIIPIIAFLIFWKIFKIDFSKLKQLEKDEGTNKNLFLGSVPVLLIGILILSILATNSYKNKQFYEKLHQKQESFSLVLDKARLECKQKLNNESIKIFENYSNTKFSSDLLEKMYCEELYPNTAMFEIRDISLDEINNSEKIKEIINWKKLIKN